MYYPVFIYFLRSFSTPIVVECPNPNEIVELLKDGDDSFSISLANTPAEDATVALRGSGQTLVVDADDEFIITPNQFKEPFRVMVVEVTVTGATSVTVTLFDEGQEVKENVVSASVKFHTFIMSSECEKNQKKIT